MEDSHTMGLFQAFNRAMPVVLPPSRLRKIPTIALISWLHNEIDNIKRIRAANARIEQEANGAVLAPIETLIHNKGSALKEITSDLLVMELLERISADREVRSELKDIKSLFNDSIAGLREFITKELKAIQKDQLDYLIMLSDQIKAIQINPVTAIPISSAPKKHRKMVLLVCLKKNQFNEVAGDFEDIFDLRLWNQDEAIEKLKSLSSNAYKIFGMTDFMSHSFTEAINSVNHDAFIPFTGGVTTLKNNLRKLASELNN